MMPCRVASACSYVRTCRRVRNRKRNKTIRDFQVYIPVKFDYLILLNFDLASLPCKCTNIRKLQLHDYLIDFIMGRNWHPSIMPVTSCFEVLNIVYGCNWWWDWHFECVFLVYCLHNIKLGIFSRWFLFLVVLPLSSSAWTPPYANVQHSKATSRAFVSV